MPQRWKESMRGYHESCENHLFHFGLHVSVLPEGHLDKKIMKIIMMMRMRRMVITVMVILTMIIMEMMLMLMMMALWLGAICTGGLGLHSSGADLEVFIVCWIIITLWTQTRERQATFLCETRSWFDLKETCTFSSLEHRLNSRSATAKARRADSVKMINLIRMINILIVFEFFGQFLSPKVIIIRTWRSNLILTMVLLLLLLPTFWSFMGCHLLLVSWSGGQVAPLLPRCCLFPQIQVAFKIVKSVLNGYIGYIGLWNVSQYPHYFSGEKILKICIQSMR